jgi:hypothetical protein
MCQTGSGINRSNERKESEMKITRIGLDLEKDVFQVHGWIGTGAQWCAGGCGEAKC